MANPIVQFVDSPSTTATLRYDFNQTAVNYRCLPLGADAIDFGVPPFDGDPEGVGGRYGYRSMSFTQRIIATRVVALARMQLLAREMLRATNYLRFQWDPTATPVFFKTYRTDPGAITLENAGSADAWDLRVPLVADPFAYGPRVTQPTVQIVQSPADLAGPKYAMRYVLPTIKGDAPTPLRVSVTPASGSDHPDWSWLFGCVSGSASLQDPVLNIGSGDGFTVLAGAAPVTTPDATFFGSDYRTFSASTTEITINNDTAWITARGRYKLLVRGEFATGVTYLMRTTNSPFAPPTVAFTPTSPGTFQGWVDLGEYLYPYGYTLPDDLSATIPTQRLSFGIKTASGTGTAKIDAFKAIPISGPTVTSTTLLRATGSGVAGSTAMQSGISAIADGDSELFWGAGSGVVTTMTPRLSGGFPYADPNAAQSVLELMAIDRGTNLASAATTNKDAQAAVDVSYYPRYLHIGDGS